MIYPRRSACVFDGDSAPNMSWSQFASVACPQIVSHSRAALRKHLKDMPVGSLHRFEYAIDETLRHSLVKEIAHRIDEDHPRPFPFHGLLKALRPQRQVKPRLEWMPGHSPESLSKSFCVAVVTAGGDLGATGDGVPVASVHSIA